MMRRLLFPVAAVCAALSLAAQPAAEDPHWLEGLGIRNIGPAGMSGRVTAIDAGRADPSVIYIGTASGGVWKSTSGGVDWRPVFDRQPVQSIGAVAIDPTNPSVVWAGTGEGNPRNTHNSGAGIYRSPDGGRSWRRMGLEATRTIHRIVVDPRDGDVVFAGAPGSAWRPNPERGVFRTRDGGATWQAVLQVDDSTGCADLVMDPSNPDKLFAALWSFGRKPWTFRSGGPGSGLYLTLDGGDTWRRLNVKGSGLPEGELGRIGLAVAPSDPDVVYAWVEAKENALYRSTDGGYTWEKRATQGIGNRPFYYADIRVDPRNENRLYSIYSMVSRSEDGGKTWEVIIPYSGVHPDHHAFWIHPDDPDLLMNGNDGGFNLSHDRGETWRFAENLPLGQFYHVAVDGGMPYRIYGGLQDNGSWTGPAYVWQSGGIRNANWQEVLFGDGFDVQPHPDDPRFGYAMWQGGNLAEYDVQTGRTVRLVPEAPTDTPLRFNWNAALALDPFDADGLYFGSQYLHHSTDRGRTWERLSGDLTTNDTARQKQAESGGLTIDATDAENFTALLAIAPSPVERGVIWTGSDDGLLHLSRDGGATWTELSGRLPGFPAGAWIPQIVASTHDAGEAFVVANDYRRGNDGAYAWHTADYGATWRRIADGSVTDSYLMSVVQDPDVADLLFLGGDRGLWFSLDRGRNWTRWSRDFPAVNVSDLVIHPTEGDLVVGTFGRALWVVDDLEPLRERARAGLPAGGFRLFVPPSAVQAEWKQPPGVRFDADAGFRGRNRPGGARWTLWLSPEAFSKPEAEAAPAKGRGRKAEPAPADSSKPTKADEYVHFTVFSPAGDTLRRFRAKADTGYVRGTWDLRARGVRWPSRSRPEADAAEPSGRPVAPGATYGLVATWKDARGREHRDTATVSVLPDPRLAAVRPVDRQRYDAYRDRWEDLVTVVSDGMDRLREAREAMDRMDAQLQRLPDSARKPLQAPAKTLRDSIAALEAAVLTPEDFKGIDGTVRLSDRLWRAGSLLDALEGPSPNADAALGRLDAAVRRYADRVNGVIEGPWPAWRSAVEALEWSPFPDLPPLAP